MHKLYTDYYSVHYAKGAIRWVRNNGIEVIRMIYAAVRDHNWGTLEPEMVSEFITQNRDGFEVNFRMKYRTGSIHFEADYLITGNGNTLVFEMAGKAETSFFSNRTGFCVLHPIAECAGKACMVHHPDGTTEKVIFPEFISPDQPMKEITGLEWEPAENIRVRLRFSGDVFEMEDQRNWTDASYKTYCRPLSLPFPYRIGKGEVIRQKVVLELEGPPDSPRENEAVTLRIDKERVFKIPAIGVQATSRHEPLTGREAAVLGSFPFDHLRFEIHLYQPNWKMELVRGSAESQRLALPLFLVICFSENHRDELARLKQAVSRLSVRVKYVLVVGKNHLPDDELFEEVNSGIRSLFPDAQTGSGVNAWFAELNRNRPQTEKPDFISFPVCPQVHATDDLSLVENLVAQRYVVESAKNLFPGKPVFVSPVTLKQRFNVVATSEEVEPETGELPPQVDARQPSLFAAQWMLCSLKYLAQSGAGLVTLFETSGWRGFIQGDFDPPLPGKFPAKKGDVFAAFQVLNELKGFDEILVCESSDPLKVEATLLHQRSTGNTKILVANFSGERQQVSIGPGYLAHTIRDIFTGNRYQVLNNETVLEGGSIFHIELNNSLL